MNRQFEARLHSMRVVHQGVTYSATVQWYGPENVYYVVSLRDITHQENLPLHELEKEYMRRKGTLVGTTMRSRWAARRRTKQYVKIWREKLAAATTNSPSATQTDVSEGEQRA